MPGTRVWLKPLATQTPCSRAMRSRWVASAAGSPRGKTRKRFVCTGRGGLRRASQERGAGQQAGEGEELAPAEIAVSHWEHPFVRNRIEG